MIDLQNISEVKKYVSHFITFLVERFEIQQLASVSIDVDYSSNGYYGEFNGDPFNKDYTISIFLKNNQTMEELNETIMHEFCHYLTVEMFEYCFFDNLNIETFKGKLFYQMREVIAERFNKYLLSHSGLVSEFAEQYKLLCAEQVIDMGELK